MSPVEGLRALGAELKLAGAAAAALTISLLLPWYEKSYIPGGTRIFVSENVSAFGVFSWVEAAVLLVALAVLALVWLRARRQPFHLPGGDGTVIAGAGGWALLLLIWRLFDKPNVAGGASAVTVGVQWGFIAAFVAAGAVVAAGLRVRGAHRPEPPNPIAAEPPGSAGARSGR